MILLGSLVERTKEKESQAINLVTELEETLNTVKLAGNKLDETTGVVTTNLYSIKEGVSTLAKTAEEITKANQYQSENVNEISLQVRDILGQVDKNDESIKTIQEQSLVVEDNISDGETKLDTLKVNVNNMESIMELSVENVGNLKTEIDNIDAITKGIRDIASKTNMLAINAQIESVKAGEFGLGFSVIASKVNELARESKDCATSVTNLMKSLNENTDKFKDFTNSSIELSKNREVIVNKLNEIYDEISSNVEEDFNSISETNNKYKEIEGKRIHIESAVSNLSSLSEELTATTEEISALVAVQNANLEEINAEVDEIKLNMQTLDKNINSFVLE